VWKSGEVTQQHLSMKNMKPPKRIADELNYRIYLLLPILKCGCGVVRNMSCGIYSTEKKMKPLKQNAKESNLFKQLWIH